SKQCLLNGGSVVLSLANGQSYPKVEFHGLVVSFGEWRKEWLGSIFSVRLGLMGGLWRVDGGNMRIRRRTACVLFAVTILMVNLRVALLHIRGVDILSSMIYDHGSPRLHKWLMYYRCGIRAIIGVCCKESRNYGTKGQP